MSKEPRTWKTPCFIQDDGNDIFEVECSSRPLKRHSLSNDLASRVLNIARFAVKKSNGSN